MMKTSYNHFRYKSQIDKPSTPAPEKLSYEKKYTNQYCY